MRWIAPVLVSAMVMLASCGNPTGDRVVVAAGTTLVDSGFLQLVADAYEQDHGEVTISIVGLGSAEAIAYADAGSADVIVTHNEALLDEYLSRAPHARATSPFVSEFIALGPEGTEAALSIVDLFARVATERSTFVSRDDGSGTNARERAIWALVPYDPSGESWYVRTGSGMGATLLVADELGGVTLSELGAYLAAGDTLRMVPISLGDGRLLDNPYHLTVVFPAELPAAVAFQDWMSSEAGARAIAAANEALFGAQVYRTP